MSNHSHPEQRSEVEGSRGGTQPNASGFLDSARNDVLIKLHIFSAHRGSSLFPDKNQFRPACLKRFQFMAASDEIEQLRAFCEPHEAFCSNHGRGKAVRETFE